MLELNFTFVLQLAAFLTFMWVLTRFFFRPILNVLDERVEKTEGLKKTAQEMEEEVERRTEEYEERLKEARVKSMEIKNALKKEGLDEEKSMLSAVTKDTKDIIEEKKGGIYEDVKKVKMEMEKLAEDISRSIAEKVLGRRVK